MTLTRERGSFTRRTMFGGALALTAGTLPLARAEGRRIGVQSGTGDGPVAAPLLFLEPFEAAFLAAATDRIIPPDDAPGGADAGCVAFIDGQLAGPFGQAANWFMDGPFRDGTDEQGYQLQLTPAELYRHCIAAADRQFGALPDKDADAQDETLKQLEKGVDLDGVPSATFFDLLVENTMEGFFADPFYGGNVGFAGWKLARFPGARGQWRDLVDSYGYEVVQEPTSIVDGHGNRGHDGHDHALPGTMPSVTP